jgi:hypothetical protein
VTREELVQLRDAIDMTLALPDSIRELLAQWLAPEAAKPNGRDPHPPVPSPPPKAASTPRPAKAQRANPGAAHGRAAERKLIAAMRDNPNLTVVALANAAGSSRSAAGERLRQMALRGVVEKDLTGRWKLRGAEPDPPQPSPS